MQSWAQPLGLLLLEEGQDYWESPTSKTETSAYPRLGLSPDTREPHSHPSTPTTRLASSTEPATAVCTAGEARQWERREQAHRKTEGREKTQKNLSGTPAPTLSMWCC